MNIIEQAKEFFYCTIPDDAPVRLKAHLEGFESVLNYVLGRLKQAGQTDFDEELVRLGMWFHDCGRYPLDSDVDHAVRGEERTRAFFQAQQYNQERADAVCHCVRAHRNRDVKPSTREAQIVAGCDSLTHLVFAPYVDMVRLSQERGETYDAMGKLARDWRDVQAFLPSLVPEFAKVYEGWKTFIEFNG